MDCWHLHADRILMQGNNYMFKAVSVSMKHKVYMKIPILNFIIKFLEHLL